MARSYRIEISPSGYSSLKAISQKKILREIARVIDGLGKAPGSQGKELLGPFQGVRSIRACRSKYRILYKFDESERIVSILVVGARKPGKEEDVYEVAKRLLKTLLGKEDS